MLRWLNTMMIQRVKCEKGQAMVELAVMLPLLIMLLFGVVEMGRIFNAYLTVHEAAREGARAGIVNATDASIQSIVKNSTGASLDNSKLNIAITPGESSRIRGSYLTVTVQYPVQLYAPIIGEITGNPVTVTGQVTMRVE